MVLVEETQSTFDRALIVNQKWIERIFAGMKTWEMRSTKTKYRGRFGLIASGTGLIVGEVTLKDSLDMLIKKEINSCFDRHAIPPSEIHLLEKYKFPWVLESPHRYERPIQYIHPQGAVIWVKLSGSTLVNEAGSK